VILVLVHLARTVPVVAVPFFISSPAYGQHLFDFSCHKPTLPRQVVVRLNFFAFPEASRLVPRRVGKAAAAIAQPKPAARTAGIFHLQIAIANFSFPAT
jgi:hypothetical protein